MKKIHFMDFDYLKRMLTKTYKTFEVLDFFKNNEWFLSKQKIACMECFLPKIEFFKIISFVND